MSVMLTKEMLLYRLSVDKIAFNPNPNFMACLWNCELLWILPDSLSRISIFFCPESKSLNASELEKERLLSLADKVKQADIDKLSKQKITIPSNLMDLFWMTQNFMQWLVYVLAKNLYLLLTSMDGQNICINIESSTQACKDQTLPFIPRYYSPLIMLSKSIGSLAVTQWTVNP